MVIIGQGSTKRQFAMKVANYNRSRNIKRRCLPQIQINEKDRQEKGYQRRDTSMLIKGNG